MYVPVKIFGKAGMESNYIKCKIVRKNRHSYAFSFRVCPDVCPILCGEGKSVGTDSALLSTEPIMLNVLLNVLIHRSLMEMSYLRKKWRDVLLLGLCLGREMYECYQTMWMLFCS
jgi:hypothetical protein